MIFFSFSLDLMRKKIKTPFLSHSPQKIAINAREENLVIALPDRVLPCLSSLLHIMPHQSHARAAEEGSEVLRVKQRPEVTQLV